MKKYIKDTNLKGVYVKRCKCCGARPVYDMIRISPIQHWIECRCGRIGKGDQTKEGAVNNWNTDNIEW